MLNYDFRPPGELERIEAIGPTKGLPRELQRAFDPTIDFEPLPAPGPEDWLAVHLERGQSYSDFLHSSPNIPDKKRNKIYLLPLGSFDEEKSPPIKKLIEYVSAYFSMDVRVLQPIGIKETHIRSRINPFTGNKQILSTDILNLLLTYLPDDAFCMIAITMEDLYPHPSWNFVFGQASLKERVGVYSFARYDPSFYGEKGQKGYKKLILWRSCKVLSHEIGHMFGLEYCIYFRCVMNGSNHLKESDARPLYLCPVDLRKLYLSIGFDIVDRYSRLLKFYESSEFYNEAKWVRGRLRRIANPDHH